MILKLLLLACLATTTIKACDYELLEDIYDYYGSDEDNSSEKPAPTQNPTSKPPEIKPRPTAETNSTDSNNSSNNATEEGRSMERKPLVRHRRRHLLRKVPVSDSTNDIEEVNEGRGLHDNYHYPDRYAPRFVLSDSKIEDYKKADVKTTRSYLMIPVRMERILPIETIDIESHDDITSELSKRGIIPGIGRKLFWVDTPKEQENKESEKEKEKRKDGRDRLAKLERISRMIHFMQSTPRKFEVSEDRNQEKLEALKLIQDTDGRHFVLIEPSKVENLRKESKEEDSMIKMQEGGEYVLLKSIEPKSSKGENNKEILTESVMLRKLMAEKVNMLEKVERKPEKKKIQLVLLKPLPDLEEEDDDEDEDKDDRVDEKQKIVNLVYGKNQQTYLLNNRPMNDRITVNNEQVEIPNPYGYLNKERTPIYIQNIIERERETPIIVPIILNVQKDDKNKNMNDESNIYRLFDESKNPDLKRIDRIKEHVIRKHIMQNAEDNSEMQDIYEKVHSSYIKNMPETTPKDTTSEENESEQEGQDHSMDVNMMVQQLPDVTSKIDFNRGFDKIIVDPTAQYLPLTETDFKVDSKDSGINVAEHLNPGPVSTHSYTYKINTPQNKNAAHEGYHPEMMIQDQRVQMHYYPAEVLHQPEHLVQQNKNVVPEKMTQDHQGQMYYHNAHQPDAPMQQMHGQQNYQNMPLASTMVRFNEDSSDNSETQAKVEVSTVSPTKHKIVNAV